MHLWTAPMYYINLLPNRKMSSKSLAPPLAKYNNQLSNKLMQNYPLFKNIWTISTINSFLRGIKNTYKAVYIIKNSIETLL